MLDLFTSSNGLKYSCYLSKVAINWYSLQLEEAYIQNIIR